METIVMFLKFGNEKNLMDLYKNGTIYMNSIQYFRKIEDDELRGDSYEGVSEIINYPAGKFEIPKTGYKGNHLGIHIKKSYDEVLGNIYSLYCISSKGWKSPEDFFINQKIKQFGSHCLIIKDNAKFLNLIENKLNELEIEYQHGFIEYYNKKSSNREVSLFEKPNEFEYQKEFRFYIFRESTEPFYFSIGSLENIAELVNANDVVDSLKIIRNNR